MNELIRTLGVGKDEIMNDERWRVIEGEDEALHNTEKGGKLYFDTADKVIAAEAPVKRLFLDTSKAYITMPD